MSKLDQLLLWALIVILQADSCIQDRQLTDLEHRVETLEKSR